MHDGGITAQPKPHAEIFYCGEVTLSCMPRSFAPVMSTALIPDQRTHHAYTICSGLSSRPVRSAPFDLAPIGTNEMEPGIVRDWIAAPLLRLAMTGAAAAPVSVRRYSECSKAAAMSIFTSSETSGNTAVMP